MSRSPKENRPLLLPRRTPECPSQPARAPLRISADRSGSSLVFTPGEHSGSAVAFGLLAVLRCAQWLQVLERRDPPVGARILVVPLQPVLTVATRFGAGHT